MIVLVTRSRVAVSAAVMTMGVVACASGEPRSADPSTAQKAALEEFSHRVQQYLAIHNRAEAEVPKLEQADDPKEVSERERALGEAIIAARGNARPGDLFSPGVAPVLREIIAQDMRARSPEEIAGLLSDQTPTLELRVNVLYPTAQPLKNTPPLLLTKLPQLPPGLEYRFIGRHMILRDVKASLIVDYMLNVVPVRAGR